MRLFFVIFLAVIAPLLASGWVWSFVESGAISPWFAVLLVALIILGALGIVAYFEVAKYDLKDKIRVRRSRNSMTPGLYLAAFYYGYLSDSATSGHDSQDVDASTSGDFGGGGDGE